LGIDCDGREEHGARGSPVLLERLRIQWKVARALVSGLLGNAHHGEEVACCKGARRAALPAIPW